jgi:glycosyltransferase involved in cell wall biosynthesis
MSRTIRICALVLDPHDINPGQRFRIEQWEPYLKGYGIEIDYFPFTDKKLREVIYKPNHLASKVKELIKANFRRLNHIIKACDYDVVFLYRAASMVGPAWLERLLSWKSIPIIYDFDDAIFLTNTSKANQRFGWAKFSKKTDQICRLSASVTVGNSYLAEYARKHNKNVHIIPTSIDTNLYQPANKKTASNKQTIIGWTGSSTSQYHLEQFEPVLAKLVKERDVEIRVISDREPSFKEISFVWRPWSSQSEIEETAQIDIGIMPIPDDEWSRGKCAAKALQYMALGIPAVCSDVGANRDVIVHNINGFLAKTSKDWLNHLKILIDDVPLRTKFGGEARKTVVENYSMSKCAELFSEVVIDTVKNNSR